MEKSDKPGDLSAPRKTLKLKAPVSRPPAPPKGLVLPRTAAGTAPAGTAAPSTAVGQGPPGMTPSPQPRTGFSRGGPRNQEAASWADEHKRRMQADMDALGAGMPSDEGAAPPRSRR